MFCVALLFAPGCGGGAAPASSGCVAGTDCATQEAPDGPEGVDAVDASGVDPEVVNPVRPLDLTDAGADTGGPGSPLPSAEPNPSPSDAEDAVTAALIDDLATSILFDALAGDTDRSTAPLGASGWTNLYPRYDSELVSSLMEQLSFGVPPTEPRNDYFTTRELLCRDSGVPDSYCRRRYGPDR